MERVLSMIITTQKFLLISMISNVKISEEGCLEILQTCLRNKREECLFPSGCRDFLVLFYFFLFLTDVNLHQSLDKTL